MLNHQLQSENSAIKSGEEVTNKLRFAKKHLARLSNSGFGRYRLLGTVTASTRSLGLAQIGSRDDSNRKSGWQRKPRTCRGLNWCGGTASSRPCGTLSNPQLIPNSRWWLGHSPLQAPQHRERLQTSFVDGFHESLLPNVEIEKQVNAEPEDEQPSPNISEGDSKGRCC